LVIDRDTASRLGITPQAIDDTLYDACGQRQVSTMFTQLNQYHVVLEAEPGFQDHPEDLKHIYVKSTSPPAVGAAGTTAAAPSQVPLSSFAHFEERNAPLAINHQGQFPVVTLSFNLAPGVSLGEATKAIEQAEREMSARSIITVSGNGGRVS
jgi:multidrug efflux pump